MKTIMKKQSGAILVMTALLVILLLGMTALALDLGRIYVQKTEMQNAADTAARAGAMELNGQSGALNRAEAAINNLLQHQAHFSRESELVRDQLSRADGSIIFYNWIGSSYDAAVPPCTPNADNKCVTTEDHDARYVEVRLYPDLVADPNAYTVDLFFLPVLGILIDDVAQVATVRARAVAGRHFIVCNYPPVMFCNLFESEGISFTEAVNDNMINVGDSLVLKYQSNTWAPGNFAFLVPKDQNGNPQTGAPAVGRYIANPNLQGCTPPMVTTRTGSVQSHPIWGWNTRFDSYHGPSGIYNPASFPPAPNVIEYPMDTAFTSVGGLNNRLGDGNWRADDYWQAFHSYHVEEQPDDWDNWTRWEVHNWEIMEGYPPCDPKGPDGIEGNADDIICLNPLLLPVKVMEGANYIDPAPTPEPDRDVSYRYPLNAIERMAARPIAEGLPKYENVDLTGSPATIPERRVLFTAVIDCLAEEITGTKTAMVSTFAKFFILQGAPQGSSPEDFVVEFMGLATEKDAEYHVEILLYE